MNPDAFINRLSSQPETVSFAETMAVIDSHYHFTPTTFSNGNLENEAGQNSGSCKIFAFGKLHNLSEQQTLACFGDYYREDVLKQPDANDHQNIRNFMRSGWGGIQFQDTALSVMNE